MDSLKIYRNNLLITNSIEQNIQENFARLAGLILNGTIKQSRHLESFEATLKSKLCQKIQLDRS